MRRDIRINTNTHELVMQDSSQGSAYPFSWISESDLFLMGQVLVPYYFDTNTLKTEGIKVSVPYTPIYKKARVKVVDPSGNAVVMNRTNSTEWFDVKVDLCHQEKREIYASEWVVVDSSENYLLQFNDDEGICWLWSAKESDVRCGDANIQNKHMMLQCIPTNNYRYPLTGVGFIKYTNSNPTQTDMTAVLEREFAADNTPVISAGIDTRTQELLLELDYSLIAQDENL